jgi:hypothetical protein
VARRIVSSCKDREKGLGCQDGPSRLLLVLGVSARLPADGSRRFRPERRDPNGDHRRCRGPLRPPGHAWLHPVGRMGDRGVATSAVGSPARPSPRSRGRRAALLVVAIAGAGSPSWLATKRPVPLSASAPRRFHGPQGWPSAVAHGQARETSVSELLPKLAARASRQVWSDVMELDRTFHGSCPLHTAIQAYAGPQNSLCQGHKALLFAYEVATNGHCLLDVVSARLGFPHSSDAQAVSCDEVIERAYREATQHSRISKSMPPSSHMSSMHVPVGRSSDGPGCGGNSLVTKVQTRQARCPKRCDHKNSQSSNVSLPSLKV